jgi:hypothetical protein
MANNIKGNQEVSVVTWDNVRQCAVGIAMWIRDHTPRKSVSLYGIPRGGTIRLSLLLTCWRK